MTGDALKEFTQKVDRVLKYTDNNLKTAQKIVKGELKDLLVLKAKVHFSGNQESLTFLIFFLKTNFSFLDQCAVYKKGEIAGLSMNDSWKTFFFKIEDCFRKGDFMEEAVTLFKTNVEKEQNPALSRQIIEAFEKKGSDEARIYFEKLIAYLFPQKPFALYLEHEQDSSLNYELTVKGSLKTDELEDEDTEAADSTSAALELKIKSKRNELLAAKNLIVKGEYILSPVKGISLSDLKENDEISVRVLKENTGDNLRVVDQLALMNEKGQIKPCRGKILALFQTSLGFKAFIQIAPFVVVETRTEPEMKVECFTKLPADAQPPQKKSFNLPVLIGAGLLTLSVIVALIVLLV